MSNPTTRISIVNSSTGYVQPGVPHKYKPMDKDKLNDVALVHCEKFANGTYIATLFDVISAFKDGVEWLMSQPLADRLTEEEKEEVRKFHRANLHYAIENTEKMKTTSGESTRQSASVRREIFIFSNKILEQIFGKEMFNEKQS